MADLRQFEIEPESQSFLKSARVWITLQLAKLNRRDEARQLAIAQNAAEREAEAKVRARQKESWK